MKIRTALAALLAFALLWWFVRGTNTHEVWAAVQAADPALLFLALVFVALTYVARAVRWQYLLAPVGPTRFRTAFRTTVIGFAVLTLLPARVGDLLRPYLLARQEHLNPTATFATVVMERVFDLLAVIGLLAIYLWGSSAVQAVPADAAAELAVVQASVGIFGGLTLVMLGCMWVLATHPERVETVVFAAMRILPHRIAQQLAELARLFSTGFAASRSPRALVLATIWSLPIWLAIAAEAWAVTRALGLELPMTGAFLLQALLVIGVAVPTPGGVGSYHAAYRYGMTTFFGAAEHQAVAAAIVLHAISFFPVVAVGLLFMAQDGLSMGGLRQLATEARGTEVPPTDEVPILRESRR